MTRQLHRGHYGACTEVPEGGKTQKRLDTRYATGKPLDHREYYSVSLQSTLLSTCTDLHWECVHKEVGALHPSCNVVVSSQILLKMQNFIPILVYVAGCAWYGAPKKLNCAICADARTLHKTATVSAAHECEDVGKQFDRGGLVADAHSYVVLEELATQPELLPMAK
ncbi:hypothetical protein MTO96_013657 [Rhipicephalus appendiculatus]